MGHRFMMLAHVGHHTGKLRQTILAVLSFDPGTREIKAISAWRGSDWFHSIQASPGPQVECAGNRYTPKHRLLTAAEIATLFIDYRRAHPLFSSIICRIPGWTINSSYQEFVELARTFRAIAFRPTAD